MGMQASLCNAVVRLKLELYKLPASQPSAVLIDGYNGLFHRTDMFEATSLAGPLRRLDAQELTLGANLRVLTDASPGHTVCVGAVSLSGSVPDLPVGLERGSPCTKHIVQPLSMNEVGKMLLYYRCATNSCSN